MRLDCNWKLSLWKNTAFYQCERHTDNRNLLPLHFRISPAFAMIMGIPGNKTLCHKLKTSEMRRLFLVPRVFAGTALLYVKSPKGFNILWVSFGVSANGLSFYGASFFHKSSIHVAMFY